MSGPEKLTQARLEKVNRWFTEKFVTLACPHCRHGQFTAIEHIFTPLAWRQGDVFINPAVPMVGVVCNNCGGVQQFSAIMMGLLEPDTLAPVADDGKLAPDETKG